MTVIGLVVAAIAIVIAYRLGRDIGRQQGLDGAASAAQQAAQARLDAERVILETERQADHVHHVELHVTVDLLLAALAEANRRLADTGVTISIPEIQVIADIDRREFGPGQVT